MSQVCLGQAEAALSHGQFQQAAGQYAANTEQGGAQDSQQFWQNLKTQEVKNVDRLKELMRKRVREGAI